MHPFSEAKLIDIAEGVIAEQDPLDHEEETGRKVLYPHFEVEQLGEVEKVMGRVGEYFRFSYTYTVEIIEEEFPDEPYKARYRRQIRIDDKGKVVAFGGRQLIEELD